MSSYRGQSALHRQQRRRALVLAVTMGSIVLLASGYYLGRRSAYGEMGIDPERYRSMLLDLPGTQLELELVSDELQVQQARNEVDRQALEILRSEIAGEKIRVADLEEMLRFYKGVMDPGDGEQGLSLRAVELVSLGDADRFAYRIVLQQAARKHLLLKGKLIAEVFGVKGGEQLSYPLKELSAGGDSKAFVLSFRYFQSVEGELTLPPGFEPRGISLVATTSSPRKSEVRAEFPWRVQEKFTHVGT